MTDHPSANMWGGWGRGRKLSRESKKFLTPPWPHAIISLALRRYLSWIEGLTTNQNVTGSNPVRRTSLNLQVRQHKAPGLFLLRASRMACTLADIYHIAHLRHALRARTACMYVGVYFDMHGARKRPGGPRIRGSAQILLHFLELCIDFARKGARYEPRYAELAKMHHR